MGHIINLVTQMSIMSEQKEMSFQALVKAEDGEDEAMKIWQQRGLTGKLHHMSQATTTPCQFQQKGLLPCQQPLKDHFDLLL